MLPSLTLNHFRQRHTIADLASRIETIAHDSMRGRRTPSLGLEKTAAYVVEQFGASGLSPGADGGFVQRFTVQSDLDAMNVIGWIDGADPEFRSGTAAILELAEAFGRFGVRPRRSIVFITFSAEELGLVGSRWYTDNPTFSLEQTFGNINLDMIGRNWRDRIVAIRSPATFGEVAERVADEHPELGLTVIDDPWPELSLLNRSDQFNFIRQGVPALFFTSGLHTDYHTPRDEPDAIDYEKTERVTRLLFFLALELAGYE